MKMLKQRKELAERTHMREKGTMFQNGLKIEDVK
jgi:hypothetical protein